MSGGPPQTLMGHRPRQADPAVTGPTLSELFTNVSPPELYLLDTTLLDDLDHDVLQVTLGDLVGAELSVHHDLKHHPFLT